MTAHGIRPAAALLLLASGLGGCNKGEETAQAGDRQAAAPAAIFDGPVPAGGIAPAVEKLTNPHKGDKKTIEAGAGLFSSMNCDGCHGGGAVGWVGPSLADGRWRYGGSDQALYQSIYYGRPKGMPAFGGALPPDAIWIIVTYLQSLEPPAAVPTQSWE